MVGTAGLRYFYKYWFFGANVNYAGNQYVELAPLKRLASNYTSVNPSDVPTYEAYKTLVDQEKFKDAYTVDFSIGKMFYLKDRRSFNMNLSVNNILNKKDIRTGGYEQGRLDLTSPNKFPSKYYYMQGINCFLSVNYKF